MRYIKCTDINLVAIFLLLGHISLLSCTTEKQYFAKNTRLDNRDTVNIDIILNSDTLTINSARATRVYSDSALFVIKTYTVYSDFIQAIDQFSLHEYFPDSIFSVSFFFSDNVISSEHLTIENITGLHVHYKKGKGIKQTIYYNDNNQIQISDIFKSPSIAPTINTKYYVLRNFIKVDKSGGWLTLGYNNDLYNNLLWSRSDPINILTELANLTCPKE